MYLRAILVSLLLSPWAEARAAVECRPPEAALSAARGGVVPAAVGVEQRAGRRLTVTLGPDGSRVEAKDCKPDALVLALRRVAPTQTQRVAGHEVSLAYGLVAIDGRPVYDLAMETPPADASQLSSFEVLSLVGPILSYRVSTSTYEAARSHVRSSWVTADVRKADEPVAVTSVVDPKSLLEALRVEPVVRRLCPTASESRTFEDLAACARLDAQVFAFAGFDADSGRAAVRLAVWDATYADLALDGPTVWVKPRWGNKSDFADAAAGKGRLLAGAAHEPAWVGKGCAAGVDTARLSAARTLTVRYEASVEKIGFELLGNGVSLIKATDCDPVLLLEEARTASPSRSVTLDGARFELGIGLGVAYAPAHPLGTLVLFDLARDLGSRLRVHGATTVRGELTLELLSRVGPVMSFRRSERRAGDGLVLNDETWRATDVRSGPARIQEVASEAELVAALRDVQAVWQLCGGLPAGLADVSRAQEYLAARCNVDVPGSFAFGRWDAARRRVDLRVAIVVPQGLDAPKTTQVAVWVTPVKPWQAAIEKAVKGEDGYLMPRK